MSKNKTTNLSWTVYFINIWLLKIQTILFIFTLKILNFIWKQKKWLAIHFSTNLLPKFQIDICSFLPAASRLKTKHYFSFFVFKYHHGSSILKAEVALFRFREWSYSVTGRCRCRPWTLPGLRLDFALGLWQTQSSKNELRFYLYIGSWGFW